MTLPDPVDPAAINAERLKRQRGRNLAMLIILLSIVVLIFAVTIVKIELGYKP